MSVIDLEEAMILSPTREQELFYARDKNDIVVYYDQSTSDTGFINNPNSPKQLLLKTLYDAIDRFSYSKQLQRAPLLLEGGIDAWIDEYGIQSLVVDDRTAVRLTPAPDNYRLSSEVSRIERKPVAGAILPYPSSARGGQLARHPTEPINIEEEKRWIEQLHKENDPKPFPRLETTRNIIPASSTPNNTVPISRTVEEFV